MEDNNQYLMRGESSAFIKEKRLKDIINNISPYGLSKYFCSIKRKFKLLYTDTVSRLSGVKCKEMIFILGDGIYIERTASRMNRIQ
jgi:hypothetical protein